MKPLTNPILVGGLVLALLAGGCSSAQKALDSYPLELSDVLAQVNNAILAAKESNAGVKTPEVTSVKLDLQIGTTSAANGGLPISLVAVEGNVERDNVQLISLTFKPKGEISSEQMEQVKATELSSAITAIYKSVANANPLYQFQTGSVKLQCALKKGAGAKLGGPILFPIQVGVNHSNELIQTITLNFNEEDSGPSIVPSSASILPSAQ